MPGEALRHLRGSRYCASDHFERFVGREFGDLAGGDKVAEIMIWIAEHLDYHLGVSDAASTASMTIVGRGELVSQSFAIRDGLADTHGPDATKGPPFARGP